MAGMGKVDAPGMTDQEKEMNKNYMNAAREQSSYIAKQLHYTTDPNTGAWKKQSDIEWMADPNVSENDKIAYSRYSNALKGNSLTSFQKQQMNDELKTLKSTSGIMGNNVNTAQGSDTIGIQRLNAMKNRYDKVADETARQDLAFGNNANSNIGSFTSAIDMMGKTGQAAANPYKEQEWNKTAAENANSKTQLSIATALAKTGMSAMTGI